MIIYRISRIEFTQSLKASGAANRWNKSRQNVIYGSENISLCALELLAHTNGIRPSGKYGLMHIEITDSADMQQVDMKDLPTDWNSIRCYPATQKIGSEWIDNNEHLLLQVPSAVIPSEKNYVINTKHPDFKHKVDVKEVTEFFWDQRFPSH